MMHKLQYPQVTISCRLGMVAVLWAMNLFPNFQRTESLRTFLPYHRPASALFQSVDVWEGPWNTAVTSSFLQEYWGQKPLLVRQAFDSGPFPSWQTILDLAVDDDAGYSARLVQHTAGDLTSFSLELGPFDPDELDDEFEDRTLKTTLLVNDVNRRRDDLADWMEHQFSFLPRWRMDDAQISIAQKGGGIGPHVDNYDVFLIQTSGQREWKVGLDKLSTADEYAALVPDIPVRILQQEFDAVEYVLKPGDMLYLPPRVMHCGTAASDRCVTLSVGCRAPSAADLIARMAEQLQDTATERYQDVKVSERTPSDVSLTTQVKESMQQMALRAILSLLEDDAAWDALVGGIITEPIRDDDLGPFDEDEDDYMSDDLGELLQSSDLYLKRSPGVTVATSTVEIPGPPASRLYRLFAHGIMWESGDSLARQIFHHVEQGLRFTPDQVEAALTSPGLKSILEELVERRLLRVCRCNGLDD
jgi:50S ribosomal protein L16 3-hydroxylase